MVFARKFLKKPSRTPIGIRVMKQKRKVLTEYLYENEVRWADIVYLRQPIGGVWHEFTWQETMRRARKVTTFLKSLGLQKGDKIAILSKNCAEWIMADFAITMGGFVSVPLYVAQLPDSIRFILTHAEVKAIFVGKLDNWEKLESAIPSNITRIDFPYENPMPANYHWNEILDRFEPHKENYVPARQDLYTILYTSGTTGDPKGVMITFDSIAHFLEIAQKNPVLDECNHQYYMSYMPLGHILERLVLEGSSLYKETTISFPESLDTFAQNLRDTSPTIFIAPPRIWDLFRKEILAQISEKVICFLLSVPIVSYLLKRKIKKQIGLSRAYWCISGSARLSMRTLNWYKRIGIEICEGYGLTEDLTYCTMQLPGETVPGTVGKAQPGTTIKLGDNNEILIKSKIMMAGYFKAPEATQEAFTEDGFFRTGDKGTIDENGYLTINGRLKDPFKTDKGEFVNPIRIEEMFDENPFIDHMCLIGMTLPHPVLLVTISQPVLMLQTKEQLTKSLLRTLNQINPDLASFEKVSHVIICKDPWSTDNGLLTPTHKIKRAALHQKYIRLARKVSNGTDYPKVYWE